MSTYNLESIAALSLALECFCFQRLTDLRTPHLSELLPRGLSQDETILLSWRNSSAYLSANWIQQNGRGSDGVCSWLGIGCGEWRGENRVTAVNLPSLNLTGPLPPRISGLSALQVLLVSHCEYTADSTDVEP